MKTTVTTALTVAVTAMAIGATPAFARGDGGQEQRAKLKAAIAESQASQASQQGGPSLFDRLFGTGEAETAEAAPKQ